MFKQTLAAALLLSIALPAAAQTSWITVGEQAYARIRAALPAARLVDAQAASRLSGPATGKIYLLTLPSAQIPRLSRLLHRDLQHCGGFMVHSDAAAGRRALIAPQPAAPRPSYVIANQAVAAPLLALMEEQRIASTIRDLSAFPNRLYSSSHGADASVWLHTSWAALAQRHGGITIASIAHKDYKQASVMATIAGSDLASEVVVLGAHLDSINTGLSSSAPGADDDASGVASLTEVLRVLAEAGYRPRRTIKLIAYAAEEVGLRGSQDIARDFSRRQVQVAAVLQLDMTNYKGSSKDIYLLSDYTDEQQNAFLLKLIEIYLPGVSVGTDVCGYACSDHASWQAQGYPTSMPFESALADDNPHIHSKHDTYANSGAQAVHALKFARLAAAFAIELGSSTP